MTTMTRHQLRAARALLVLRQDVLAEKAKVGVATIRRFENGVDVAESIVDALRDAVLAEGAILVASGTVVAGTEVSGGVLMVRQEDLPSTTKARLAVLDQTPEQAYAELPLKERAKVGRRKRTPRPSPLDKTKVGGGSEP